MEEKKPAIQDTPEGISETATSSDSETLQSEDNSFANPDSKYVGSYLRWLGDKLDKEKFGLKRYAPPKHLRTAPCIQVGRDLAWIGDELDNRRRSSDQVSDLVVDFPPCCVIILGVLCYVVVCGLRMR